MFVFPGDEVSHIVTRSVVDVQHIHSNHDEVILFYFCILLIPLKTNPYHLAFIVYILSPFHCKLVRPKI